MPEEREVFDVEDWDEESLVPLSNIRFKNKSDMDKAHSLIMNDRDIIVKDAENVIHRIKYKKIKRALISGKLEFEAKEDS